MNSVLKQVESQTEKTHSVTMVAFDGAALLDVTGPLQVFGTANSLLGRKHYSIYVATWDGAPAVTDSEVRVHADLSLREHIPHGTLAVAGGDGVDALLDDPDFINCLRSRLQQQTRIVSICSGSMLLARTGILDGRRASCHWSRRSQVLRLFPKVHWTLDQIYTSDGHIFTSAGVTTGIDLALTLVEMDLGQELALSVARELIVYTRRSGSSDQLSIPLRSQFASSSRIRALCESVMSTPNSEWSVSEMAVQACMTERSLHRHFLREIGVSPARFVESVRLDLAKVLVEQGNEPLERISQRSGFQSAQNLRRAFMKLVGATPSEYRKNHLVRHIVEYS